MIYISTVVCYMCFDISPVNSKPNHTLAMGLLAFNVLFTWAYLLSTNVRLFDHD